MLPLLNWTFYFISVGRSKGSDHFIFIITINLSSEIFMYTRGIVDSDEYGSDDNLVVLTITKKQQQQQKSKPMLSVPFSALHVVGCDSSQLAQFLLNPGTISIMASWFSKEWGTLKVVVQCEEDIVYLMQDILLIPPNERNGGNRET